MRTVLTICVVSGSLLVWGLALAMTSRPAPTEHELKAAYLLNILRFAEQTPPSDPARLTLCLLAPGPIEGPLAALENTEIQNRRLRLREVRADGGIQGCDVLFVGRAAGQRKLVGRANSQGILTIGAGSDFLAASGMMALLVEGRRIVICIDRSALEHRGWRFSSHLLEVARIVGGGR